MRRAQVPKYGHKHVLWPLSMASTIGCLTVVSSKAVSTFINLTIAGAVDPAVPFNDQIQTGRSEEGCEKDGHTWGPIERAPRSEPFAHGCIIVGEPTWNDDGEIIAEGSSQLAEWGLYMSLVVMIVTAVSQVKYINKGMENFGNSEVIPTHYVTFTLFSIIATSIIYQEFSITSQGVCPRFIYVHLFIDGILMTFLGVWLITSNRLPAERLLLDEDEIPGAGWDDPDPASEDGVHIEMDGVGRPAARLDPLCCAAACSRCPAAARLSRACCGCVPRRRPLARLPTRMPTPSPRAARPSPPTYEPDGCSIPEEETFRAGPLPYSPASCASDDGMRTAASSGDASSGLTSFPRPRVSSMQVRRRKQSRASREHQARTSPRAPSNARPAGAPAQGARLREPA